MTGKDAGFTQAFNPSLLYIQEEDGRPTYQFAYGCPRTELLPLEEFRAALDGAMAAPLGRRLLQYAHLGGHPELLEALASRLRSWGLERASPDTLLVTCGSSQALDMVCRFLGRGGAAVTETPAYPGFMGAAAAGGLSLLEVPLDDDGLDPDRLDHCLRAAREATGAAPAFAYLIPDYQNPSGVLLHPGRRAAVAEVAARAGTVLVEDLTYHELRYDGQAAPPLGSLAPDGVVTLGSFSKAVFPGLRLGWLHAAPELMSRLAFLGASLGLSGLLQEAVCRLMAGGEYDRIGDRYRRAFREQRDAMVSALEAHLAPECGSFVRPQGGFFVWFQLPPRADSARIAARCLEAGVYALPSPMFYPAGRPCPPALRLAFCFEAPGRIPDGVAVLARVVRQEVA